MGVGLLRPLVASFIGPDVLVPMAGESMNLVNWWVFRPLGPAISVYGACKALFSAVAKHGHGRKHGTKYDWSTEG